MVRARDALRDAAASGALGSLLLLSACGSPARPLFAGPDTDLAWPPPPHPARIRYMGELRSSRDLGAAVTWWQSLLDAVLGEEDPQEFHGPRAAVLTDDGRVLWVADTGGRCVHRLDLVARTVLKIDRAGDAPLLSPVGVCAGPEDSVYVCDSEAVAIHRLAAGDGTLVASIALPESLLRPVAACFDPSAGELFVVDVAAHDVKVLDTQGALLRILGRRGIGPGEFNHPCDVKLHGDTLWIADAGNCRVQRLSRQGEALATLGGPGDAPGDMAMPKAMALDGAGHVYVVDARFENVQIFDQAGRLLLFFGHEGTGPGEFWLPGGVFIDSRDWIWICDAYNRRIQVFAYVGE